MTFIKFVLIFGVIINGFGAAVIWIATGEYFSKCATEKSRGFYFGLFWSIYQGSQIFSSLIGALMFKFNVIKTYF